MKKIYKDMLWSRRKPDHFFSSAIDPCFFIRTRDKVEGCFVLLLIEIMLVVLIGVIIPVLRFFRNVLLVSVLAIRV